MAEYRVRGEGFAETLTADDWRVCDGDHVVFYTGDEKVAYYRSPVSVKTIRYEAEEVTRAHAETKKIAAERDHFQQYNIDLKRVVEGLRNERDDWKAESHRRQEVIDKLCERHTQEDWDAAMAALKGARESRDRWQAESHRLHEELRERPTQEDLDAAVTALKGARDYWRDKYQDKDKAALGKIRELQQELETAKEGGEYWYKEYWQLLSTSSAGSSDKELNKQVQHWKDKYTELARAYPDLRDKAFWQTRCKEAETTIRDLRRDLNSSKKQSASLEDLREAQRSASLAAKRNDWKGRNGI
jgi:hypothetical protein